MTAVFRQQEPIVVVDDEWIARVKEHARLEPLRRARLNLHHSESDRVQEMLIAICSDSLIAPHRHLGRSETLHVIEGRALIVFFDEEGREVRRLRIGPAGGGLPPLYRLAADTWHVVIPLDEVVVIHETAAGPFEKDRAPPPNWAPTNEEGLRQFIDALRRD